MQVRLIHGSKQVTSKEDAEMENDKATFKARKFIKTDWFIIRY